MQIREDLLILVGCPLPTSFRADARTVGMLESWRRKNVITYYPATNSAEQGQDKIVSFAKSLVPRPTHILFVDYDVLPKHNALVKLLEHDKDIVCGVYLTTKRGKFMWCLSKDEEFKLMDVSDLPDEPFKVKIGCNGMMLVKTEVFDNIQWPYWRSQYKEGGLKLIGADVSFYYKAAEAGYDIWIDPDIQCGHFKMVDLLTVAHNYAIKNGVKAVPILKE